MQEDLFGTPAVPTPPNRQATDGQPGKAAPLSAPPATPRSKGLGVRPVTVDDALHTLAGALPQRLRLGTSSWTYPAWAGLVWDAEYAETQLSKHGLAAYAAHPLLRYRAGPGPGHAALVDGAPPAHGQALGQRMRPSLVDLFVALTRKPELAPRA